MNARLRALLALICGLAAALGFAPLNAWPLTILGTAGLVALVESTPGWRAAAREGWLWGLGMFVASLTWIATAFTFQSAMPAFMGWVAVIGLSAFLALYPMLAAALAVRLSPAGLPRLLMLAGAFMLTEWLRGVLLSGFAWNPLGVAWLHAPGVVQLAALIGAQGLSGLMVLAGGAVWALAGYQQSASQRLQGGGLVLLLLVAGAYGSTREQEVYYPDNPALVIVQPNIGQDEKYDPGANARHLNLYLAMTAQALSNPEASAQLRSSASGEVAEAQPFTGVENPFTGTEGEPAATTVEEQQTTISEQLSREGLAVRPNLVIWSESAVFGLPEEDQRLRTRLASVLGPQDLLMFGGVSANRDANGEIESLFNSMFVLNARGEILARYDKSHLTPLGEYVPARPVMEALGLARLAPGTLDFIPGPGPKTFALPGIPPFCAMICYEIIFGGHVTEFGQRPAWIINISNDAWFGPSGPPQHLAQAQLRAIEEGLPIARATPTGISAVIGPRGKLFAQARAGTRGILNFTLPPPLPATPYASQGNLIPIVLALLIMAAGVALGRRAPDPTAKP